MEKFTSQIVDFLEYKDGDPGTICWLNCSTLIHTGGQQKNSIIVRAIEKRGSGIEKIDYSAILRYQYEESGEAWTYIQDNTFTFDIPLEDKNLIIQGIHRDKDENGNDIEIVFDSETITYSPLNTPILDLTNDNASIAYNGEIKLGDATVSSTANLYLNGEALDAEIFWLLENCIGTASNGTTKWSVDTGSFLKTPDVPTGSTLVVSDLTENIATATCLAFEKLYNPALIIHRSSRQLASTPNSYTEEKWQQWGQIGATSTDGWTSSITDITAGDYFVVIGKSSDENKNHAIWYEATGSTSTHVQGIVVAHTTFFEKDFTITKQLKGDLGDSSYNIDISNDVIRIILPENGKIINPIEKTVIVKLFDGHEDKSSSLDTPFTSKPEKITVSERNDSNSEFTITITPEEDFSYDSVETVTFTGGGATSTLTIEKVFNGPAGQKGDDAVEWYVVPNATSIKKTVDENRTVTYSPDKITVAYYQQVGNNAPSEVTKGSFGFSFRRHGDNIIQLPSEGLEAHLFQDQKTLYFFYQAEDSSDWVLWDWATFETLQDGEKGSDGVGLSGQLEFYYATSSNSAPSTIEIGDQVYVSDNLHKLVNGTGGDLIGYSADNFFGTSNKKGVWDIRDDNLIPVENTFDNSYVWKVIVVKNDLSEYYTATGFMRVSELDAATMAAAVQLNDSSSGSERVGTWCKYAGITIIDGSTIVTGSITANQLSANALCSNNYGGPTSNTDGYAESGTFFDLSKGSLTSKNFVIDDDGNVKLKGVITAENGGSIGGWNIHYSEIYNNQVGICGNWSSTQPSLKGKDIYSQPVFYCGSTNPSVDNSTFLVLRDGSLYARYARISGEITATSGSFTGTITADDSTTQAKLTIQPGSIHSRNTYQSKVGFIKSKFKDVKLESGGLDFLVTTATGVESVQAKIEFYPNGEYMLPNGEYCVPFRLTSRNMLIGARYDMDPNTSASTIGKLRGVHWTFETQDSWTETGEIYSGVQIESSVNIHSGYDLYIDGQAVSGSDRNIKNTINTLGESYSLIFDQLRPVTFKYNNNRSDRLHFGFIAQEVEQAVLNVGLTTKDFGAICYSLDSVTGEKHDYKLRYGEFIAMCVNEIQKLKTRVAELETQQNDCSLSNE